MASLNHDEFCIVPVGQWRQSLYDYARDVSQSAFDLSVPERSNDAESFIASIVTYQEEISRREMLASLAYTAALSNCDGDIVEEKDPRVP